uniref:Retrovirus-related Pol polyprotein from transposon TNT 1-94 n=1 Tax=Cajanus cajan TaxID=3821 RepID=A0A151S5D5_CAJCA|nr:Retrovirus-related Pol polyprotein from transposon TNT 1-94 [Cajanus cajan]
MSECGLVVLSKQGLLGGCYLANGSSFTAIDLKTPQEAWSGKPFDFLRKRRLKILQEIKVQKGGSLMLLILAYDLALGENLDSDEPKSYKEAIQSGCKWVLKRKEGIPGVEPSRFKARLVAKSFSQKEGIDYHEFFSPVVKHKTIRVLLAMVSALDMELEQLNVKTEFLHENLEEHIYMSQPDGFLEAGKGNHVCLLKKSLYGLKWYKRFGDFMVSYNFVRNEFDNCIYSRKLSDGSYIYLLLYVDDMLIVAKSNTNIDAFKAMLSSEFRMKDLGATKKISGMKIWRDRNIGLLYVSQKKYIEKLLQSFQMENSKPVSTPLAAHFKFDANTLPSTDEEKEYMNEVPYSSAIGNLMYVMVCTRPDLDHAMSVVSRFMSNHGKAHWETMKWIMQYLNGTSNICLVYVSNDIGCGLIGYADFDYGGDLVRIRSLTCYIFTLYSCAVSWKATLQPIVTLSITKAEYMFLTEGLK